MCDIAASAAAIPSLNIGGESVTAKLRLAAVAATVAAVSSSSFNVITNIQHSTLNNNNNSNNNNNFLKQQNAQSLHKESVWSERNSTTLENSESKEGNWNLWENTVSLSNTLSTAHQKDASLCASHYPNFIPPGLLAAPPIVSSSSNTTAYNPANYNTTTGEQLAFEKSQSNQNNNAVVTPSSPPTISSAAAAHTFSPLDAIIKSNNFYSAAPANGFSQNTWTGKQQFGTIINDTEFPQLGGWTPPSFNGGGGGGNDGRGTTTSPMVLSSTSAATIHQFQQPQQQHPTSSTFQNAFFNREPGIHVNRLYANTIRDSLNMHERSTEYRMQADDFPALTTSRSSVPPGFQHNKTIELSDETATPFSENNSSAHTLITGRENITTSAGNGGEYGIAEKAARATSTTFSGIMSNISPSHTNSGGGGSLLNDQYGMAGILNLLTTIKNDPSLMEFTFGIDVTNFLGLNWNVSKSYIHHTFAGPWADSPCRIQDTNARVPEEYIISQHHQPLPNIKMNKFTDDVLFYVFYNYPGEVYQIAAASELYQRDWRFHIKERVWLTRSPYATNNNNNQTFETANNYEKRSYTIFDPTQWRKIPKDMVVDVKDLDVKPSAAIGLGGGASTSAANLATPGNGVSVAANTIMPPFISGMRGGAGGMVGGMQAAGMHPLRGVPPNFNAAAAMGMISMQQQMHPSALPNPQQIQQQLSVVGGGGNNGNAVTNNNSGGGNIKMRDG